MMVVGWSERLGVFVFFEMMVVGWLERLGFLQSPRFSAMV